MKHKNMFVLKGDNHGGSYVDLKKKRNIYIKYMSFIFLASVFFPI